MRLEERTRKVLAETCRDLQDKQGNSRISDCVCLVSLKNLVFTYSEQQAALTQQRAIKDVDTEEEHRDCRVNEWNDWQTEKRLVDGRMLFADLIQVLKVAQEQVD